MFELPPLRFQPILREYLWGGRRLGSELGKPIGSGSQYAESWEIVDHGADQSIVASGPLAGRALDEIVRDHAPALFGRHRPQRRFPLLFKFLDACQTLSVQVHPNDAQAALLDPPDLGKTEAWVVLDAEPGSKLYAGLKPGVDRQSLARHIAAGTCEECLHAFEPRVGDCVLIEAGTVHAIGAGLLIAEIQQASDATFRLFDWNRVDRDGRPRELHVDQALDVIDFGRGPIEPTRSNRSNRSGAERLATNDKFVVDRYAITELQTFAVGNRFHILAVTDASIELRTNAETHLLHRGDTMLVPACCENVQLAGRGRAVVLDMYLP